MYINDCHKRAIANQYVYSPFGQRKQEHGARNVFKGSAVYNAALRNAQNVSIQGPASTFGLICFSMLNRALKERGIGRAVLTVYDSIEFEVLKGHEAEAIELAYYYLDDWPVDNFDWLDFKVGCDGELGPTFGTLWEVHRGTDQVMCDWLMKIQDEDFSPPSCSACGGKSKFHKDPYSIKGLVKIDHKCTDVDNCGHVDVMDLFTEDEVEETKGY